MTSPQQTELLAAVAAHAAIEVPTSLLEDLGRPALASDLRALADEGLVSLEDDVVSITEAGRAAITPSNSA